MQAADTANRSLALSILAFAGFYLALAIPVLWGQRPQVAWVAASLALAFALGVLSAIDIREYRLPDVLTLPLIGAGVLASWGLGLASPSWAMASAAIAFALLTGVSMLYRRVRGRDGLGLGDAKLFAASGAWLGLEGLPAVLLVACGAAIVALLVMASRSQVLSVTTRIPFGPFLAFGTWVVWLYGAS